MCGCKVQYIGMRVGAVYRDGSGRRTVFNVWMWELGIGMGVGVEVDGI